MLGVLEMLGVGESMGRLNYDLLVKPCLESVEK